MWAAALSALLGACTSGPGRDPVFEDASVMDAEVKDLGVGLDRRPFFDAGDVAVGVSDFGTPTAYPFSGLFQAFGQVSLLAREIDGRLLLVVGEPPYIYVGTISPEGEVDLGSGVLARSGCPGATVKGHFERTSATFELQHQTCGADGAPRSSELRGGFAEDYTHALSGVYEGYVGAVSDPGGCGVGLPLDATLRWGVGITSGGLATLVTSVGVEAEPRIFIGRANGAGFSALAPIATGALPQEIAAAVTFVEAFEGMPATMGGRVGVFRTDVGCGFEIDVALTRVALP